MPEYGMSGGWTQNHRVDIVVKYQLIAVFTIKQENKINFGVCFGDPLKGLKRKPANTIKLSRHQEPGIHSNCSAFYLLVQILFQYLWSELITFVLI